MKTNRRNFIRTLTGFSILPVTLSLADSKQQKQKPKQISIKQPEQKFNLNNLIYNGTFEQWIESIASEVRRLLAIKSNEPDAHYFEHKYAVKTKSCDWNFEQDGSIPAISIEIYLGDLLYLWGHFSFAEFEWKRNHKHPKMLQQMAWIRFIDCVWSMYNLQREHYIILKKFGIDPSIYVY